MVGQTTPATESPAAPVVCAVMAAGELVSVGYRSLPDERHHVALVRGDVGGRDGGLEIGSRIPADLGARSLRLLETG